MAIHVIRRVWLVSMSFTVLGTGSSVPELCLSNKDMTQFFETSDEWITTRTGIKTRRLCTSESVSSMAVEAAGKALENAAVSPDKIDLIIATTLTGEYVTPSLSCIINGEIGTNCPCFDINAACTGFLYALNAADAYFMAGKAEYILVVSSEEMSKFANWTDRSTAVLFGDGAGACVLKRADEKFISVFETQSNIEVLNIPSPYGNFPYNKKERREPYLIMKGQEVFRFAVTSMTEGIKKACASAGLTQQDVDYVLVHQANMRIIKAAQSRLEIDACKYLTNIDKTGNTSSSSIPILLDEENRKNRFKRGDIIALSAFGGGLTNAACIIKW